MAKPSLKQKTVSGFKWLAFNQIIQRVIRVIAFAILSRILEPSVFGLFAMAFIAVDGFSLFKSFGVDAALIQRREDESFERAKHTAFYLVQLIGIGIFVIFQITAPIVGSFLKNQEVVTIMRVLGVIFIIGNLGRIPNVLLTKRMEFRLLSIIEFVTSVINAVCSVIFALIWPNVWSLVLAYLVKQLFYASSVWWFERYRIKFVFDPKIAKQLFHFGKFLVGIGFIGYLGYNLDSMLISRYLGATALGFFVMAANVTAFTQQQVMQHLGRVLFPAMASLQDEPERIKGAYLKSVRFISTVAIPFSLGIILVAKDFVLAFYGDKWLAIVPMIQLLAIAQLADPLTGTSGAVFMGCGKTKYNYYTELLRFALRLITAIPLMKHFGIMGIVYSSLIVEIMQEIVVFVLVKRLIHFTIMDYVRQLIPSTFCSICMLGIVYAVKFLLQNYNLPSILNFHNLLPLALFALAGLPTYIFAYYLVDRVMVKEIFNLIFHAGKAA
jgi:O-antigen/teichoic acid export membrane protein